MEQIKSENKAATAERNLGIDALRIFSMLLIVLLHIYNKGGLVVAMDKEDSLVFQLNYPVRLLCMASVNLYALISGYVMVNSRFRPARFMELWLQTLVIGLVSCLIWTLFKPERVSFANWGTALLPVTQREYWYFTAYAGLYLLTPLLNRGLRAMNERQHKALMLGIFGLFSLGWLLGKLYFGDSFNLGGGYSVIWLVLLYIMGAGFKRTGFLRVMACWKLWLGVLLSVALLWLAFNILRLDLLSEVEANGKKIIMSYCNPLIVTLSLCVFALFCRLRISGTAELVIRFLSPLTFGVYLIHVHPLTFEALDRKGKFLGELPPLLVLPAAIGIALGVFLLCALLDWLRSLLFRLLHVRRLCDTAERSISKIWR